MEFTEIEMEYETITDCFGDVGLAIEREVFNSARRLTAYQNGMPSEYQGGMWGFIKLENGGAMMVVPNEELLIQSPNGYSCKLGRIDASIVINMFALSNLSFDFDANEINKIKTEMVIKNYHLIQDFLYTRAKSEELYQLLD